MLIIILTLVLFAITALGFQVFSCAPGRKENRAFALFSWLMALWVVNDLAFWGFHGANEDATRWSQTALFLALATQLASLWFSLVFPVRRRLPWPAMAIVVSSTALALSLIASGHAMGPVGFRNNVFEINLTAGTFVVGAIIYFHFLLAHALLINSYRNARDQAQRDQLRALLLAAWTSSSVTGLLGVVLPLLGVTRALPYFSLGILAGCLVHGYGILNFRLFQPESLLSRLRLFPVTAKLSLTVSAASLSTVLIVLLIARAYIGPGPWKQALVFGLLASSLPAMTLIFLVQGFVTKPLQTITEAAIKVAEGDVTVRVSTSGSRDEVAVLATSFNTMVQRLEHDLEELRAMSRELLQSERLATAGALAAGVAHEVNNPLAAVSSLVQIVQGRLEEERDRKMLDQALEQMDRIARAMTDLLELARPREERREKCDLGAIATKTIRLLRYDKGFRELTLELKAPSKAIEVEVDPDQIQQLLMNLLLNARDAIDNPDQGRITLSIHNEEKVRLEVADNGHGIEEQDLNRVFEPFFTTKGPQLGTGLGLAVSRDIARAHDGSLELHSQPGQGTRVTLTLPRSSRDQKD